MSNYEGSKMPVAMQEKTTSLMMSTSEDILQRIKLQPKHFDSPPSCSRGKLIVFEGLDRVGKSTQISLAEQKLKNRGLRVKCMKFPSRDGIIGSIINSYLSGDLTLTNESQHLLFTMDRMERAIEIEKCIHDGTTVLLDRYVHSGIAYSVAKGLPFQWCKMTNTGLPKPDAVIFINVTIEEILLRMGDEKEIHDTSDMQSKVKEVFWELKDHSWACIRATGLSKSDVHDKIMKVIAGVLSQRSVRLEHF